MMLLPSIDLMDGKCVRLSMGRADRKKEYSGDPADTARAFEESGADMIHVVDLDAAFDSGRRNTETLLRIVESVRLPVQTGGGIRTMDDVSRLLDKGVSRVVLGTAAVKNPDLVAGAVKGFGAGRVAVAIDSLDGKVSVRGWLEQTALKAVDLALKMKKLGVAWIVYTDIGRDGMLSGPDIDGTIALAQGTGMKIIASGGIHSLTDIRRLLDEEASGIAGFITGKAVYEGKFTVREAADLTRKAREKSGA